MSTMNNSSAGEIAIARGFRNRPSLNPRRPHTSWAFEPDAPETHPEIRLEPNASEAHSIVRRDCFAGDKFVGNKAVFSFMFLFCVNGASVSTMTTTEAISAALADL
ncbi:hypothetical protein RMSM_07658 [Rhodopirellula maiorica SM1]|uniref:Uncharacterized protein n=1 Tax=Rhodopirellula maiorica SM1 TaxID=1265738 RepID=M5R7R0_9BACT|nr:hypothetical protein RMSM_07658 [Rhodopirellula maiorica SM1]